MLEPRFFIDALAAEGIDFFTGVPDSLLKAICAYITANLPASNHVIAANEGGAMGLAAGYHLATGRIPVVYMQNSGEGNAVNPLMSLTDKDVYNIPVLLLIGWRGEPGVHDEPQHVKQGKVTIPLLDAMGIPHEILSLDEAEAAAQVARARAAMVASGEAYALVVRKGTFAAGEGKLKDEGPGSRLELVRERAIEMVAGAMEPSAVAVSTTGMISRELFEIRERAGQGHARDFLTVGSMGHASQIALGIAMQKPERRVYCLDGDGASIMHMGNMAIAASRRPRNLVHVVFNNGAHDSVGGQPTVGLDIDLPKVAEAVGYASVLSVKDAAALGDALASLRQAEGSVFLEVKVRKGARKDLGRPTTTPIQNKEALMAFLNEG